MSDERTERTVVHPSWLVWAKSAHTPLGPLMDRFAQDRDIEVIKALGPPDAPHTLVVQMAAETAHQYQVELHDEFLLEPNAPLSPQANSS